MVVAGGLLDWQVLGLYHCTWHLPAAGAAILLYNLILWAIMRASPAILKQWHWLLAFACAQILLDLAVLTLLTAWTGGHDSPLRGFYVFHMVFASVLLPREMAYAGAAAALLMLEPTLWLMGPGPADRGTVVGIVSLAAVLFGTVSLTSHITRRLRESRRQLMRQNRHIRALSLRLKTQQQAIIQQEKMAALGQMAAGVAHEISNPLASMDSLLQLIERRPEKLRPDSVGTLRGQVQRINQIVRQMTAFAHPDEGQWREASLNEVAENALRVLRFDPRFKHVKLEEKLAPTPPTRMLAAAMEQVVINLVINALDAMEGRENATLVVETQAADGVCSLAITDNGTGIPPDVVERIFEPFFTTKPVGKGTGLGLSISYSLVKKHHGEIAVDSSPGQGTTFRVSIPVQKASRDREGQTKGVFHA
jgi:signal transduction histidine kinase